MISSNLSIYPLTSSGLFAGPLVNSFYIQRHVKVNECNFINHFTQKDNYAKENKTSLNQAALAPFSPPVITSLQRNPESCVSNPWIASQARNDEALSIGETLTEAKEAVQGPRETDPHKLAQRKKQISFGYITPEYSTFRANVSPTSKSTLILTPNLNLKMSKRTWDKLLAEWRRGLHDYDNVSRPANYEKRADWINCTLPKIELAKQETFTITEKLKNTQELHHVFTNLDLGETLNNVQSYPLSIDDELCASPMMTKVNPLTFFSNPPAEDAQKAPSLLDELRKEAFEPL